MSPRVQNPWRSSPRRESRRVIYALLLGTLVTALAIGGIYVTTAPKNISLLVEPVSLLLMPGLIVSLVLSGPHDYSPNIVIFVSLFCYAIFFYFVLGWRAPRPKR